ncbi:uncharacterized protein TM35_001121030, partial [Trypanosoma theileri]
MMMRRVMCVLAVVLCCACGYTMTAAATTVNAGQPKAVMAHWSGWGDLDLSVPKKAGPEPDKGRTGADPQKLTPDALPGAEERKDSLVSSELESHSVTGDGTVSPSQVQVQEQQKVVRPTEDEQSLQVSQPKEQP